MILHIADFTIDISCTEKIVEHIPNLQPFLNENETKKYTPLCRITTERQIPEETSSPTLSNHVDGKLLQLWLAPDYCSIALRVSQDKHTYRLRADRYWRHVETNWSANASPEAYRVLDNFIMIAFIYSSSFHRTTLIHASCVSVGEEGVAFIGPSGIGKSTHSQLWLKYVPCARLLNDDQPVVRLFSDGTAFLYGSPWSGKTPCYRNEKTKLKTLFFMEQAQENQALRLNGVDSFQRLMIATSLIGQDELTFAAISDTQAIIAGKIPAYLLKNRPEREAAILSYGILKNGKLL